MSEIALPVQLEIERRQVLTISTFVNVEVSRPVQNIGGAAKLIRENPTAILTAYKVAVAVPLGKPVDRVYSIHPVNTLLVAVRAVGVMIVSKACHISIIRRNGVKLNHA